MVKKHRTLKSSLPWKSNQHLFNRLVYKPSFVIVRFYHHQAGTPTFEKKIVDFQAGLICNMCLGDPRFTELAPPKYVGYYKSWDEVSKYPYHPCMIYLPT